MARWDDLLVDHDALRSTAQYIINGDPIADEQHEEIVRTWLFEDFESATDCPFCLTLFQTLRYSGEETDEIADVCVCPHCSHWRCWHYVDVARWYDESPLVPYHAGLSKLRDFEKSLPEGCHEQLAQHLRRNPGHFNRLPPRVLEQFVTSVFRSNYTDAEVIHVGKPGDGGVDVFFIDSNGRQWLIQVKARQRSSAAEGVGVLRSLLGSMILGDARYGAVVTSADHFTYRALEAANRAREVGFKIELIDRGILNRMIAPLLPDRPWMEFFVDYPHILDWFDTRMPSRKQLRLFD